MQSLGYGQSLALGKVSSAQQPTVKSYIQINCLATASHINSYGQRFTDVRKCRSYRHIFVSLKLSFYIPILIIVSGFIVTCFHTFSKKKKG